MSRFIQQEINKKPTKEPKPKPLPKAGSYTGKQLEKSKTINTMAGKI